MKKKKNFLPLFSGIENKERSTVTVEAIINQNIKGKVNLNNIYTNCYYCFENY